MLVHTGLVLKKRSCKWWSGESAVFKLRLTPDHVKRTWPMSRYWSWWTEPPWGAKEVNRDLSPWGAEKTWVTRFTLCLWVSASLPQESAWKEERILYHEGKNNSDLLLFLSPSKVHKNTEMRDGTSNEAITQFNDAFTPNVVPKF